MLKCPRCSYEVDRIHRTRFEHTVGLVYPVYRFRCSNSKCGWTGLILDKHKMTARLFKLLFCAIGFVILYKFFERIVAH